MPHDRRRTIVVTLCDEGRDHSHPLGIRLRLALKLLKRVHGLRCVAIEEKTQPQPQEDACSSH